MILPFFISDGIVAVILGGFIGYLLVFEMISIFACKKSVQLQIFNPYLWIQVISGLLKKVSILAIGYVSGISIKSGEIGAIVFAIVAILSIAVNQFKTLEMWNASKKLDHATVLPYVERS